MLQTGHGPWRHRRRGSWIGARASVVTHEDHDVDNGDLDSETMAVITELAADDPVDAEWASPSMPSSASPPGAALAKQPAGVPRKLAPYLPSSLFMFACWGYAHVLSRLPVLLGLGAREISLSSQSNESGSQGRYPGPCGPDGAVLGPGLSIPFVPPYLGGACCTAATSCTSCTSLLLRLWCRQRGDLAARGKRTTPLHIAATALRNWTMQFWSYASVFSLS